MRGNRPPRAERADGLKYTLISNISAKLQRMDIDDLRKMNITANQLIQRKKRTEKGFLHSAEA